MGWLLKVSQPFSATDTSDTQYVYDKGERKVSEFDPLNVQTCYEYDFLDRITKKTEAYGTPDQRTTTFIYNALGQILTKQYIQGTNVFTTAYTYDGLGRLKAVSGAREYPTTYGYDENGNIISITDGCTNITQFQFDAYNRQARK